MTAVCPHCGAEQGAALLCNACTTRLEKDLGDVAAIVEDLDVTLSKMAKVGNASGPGGLARERSPLNLGAMAAGDNLANKLTTWARDVCGDVSTGPGKSPSVVAAWLLLSDIPAIRRHPAVTELVTGISDAIHQARRVVDRPADRVYLGQCHYEEGEVVCLSELYASPGASEVRCRQCGVTHPVEERRAWLLLRAADMLVSVKEAASYLGEVGGIKVTESSIRGYLHRGTRLVYRPPVDAKRFRLGDLLDVLMDESERRTA